MGRSTKVMRELENKTKEQLINMLSNLQKSIMIERAKISSGVSSENPSLIRNNKRKIARIKFILKNKYGYNV